MANPTADFPAAVHENTDISAYTSSPLGSTAKTHTQVEGKQEEELLAICQKLGIGASAPSSGKVLYSTSSGQSAWTDLNALVDSFVNNSSFLQVANNLSDLGNASTARSNLGLIIGTHVQAYSANLDEYAGVNPTLAGLALLDDADAAAQLATLGLTATAAELNYVDGVTSAIQTQLDAKQPLDTDLTTIAGLTATTDNFIVSVASAWASRTPSQVRTTLGLVVGTDVQAQDAELAALAGLTSAANKLPYFTGSGTASLADFTAAGRALIDDADASAQRTTLGLIAGGAGDIWVEKAGDTMTGQLFIDGGSDQIQLLVQGNATQTSSVAVFENSAGADQITFSNTGAAVFNEAGNDADFRIEGDNDSNLFFLDASTDRIGFGTNAPAEKFHLVQADFCTMRLDSSADEAFFYADGTFHFIVLGSRSATPFRLVYNSTQRMDFSSTENVLNDNGADIDTRIESDLYDAFLVDAGNNATHIMNHASGKISFFAATAATKQASGENLTNNVTSGGTDGTIANYTDLTLYATDAAAIRNNIYQLARKLKQVNDSLRTYGLLT